MFIDLTNSLAAHFAKRNTKFGGGGKRGRANIPSPPTPFPFARPSVQFGARLPAEASAQAGSAPSIPFKKGSDFVKQTHSFGGRVILETAVQIRLGSPSSVWQT